MQLQEMTIDHLYDVAVETGIVFALNGTNGVSFAPPALGDDIERNSEVVACALEIASRLQAFNFYAHYRLRKESGNPMTELEFSRLPEEQHEGFDEVRLDLARKTKDEHQELLAIEGYEFVGTDDRFPKDQFKDRSEAWKREIGGPIEWAKLYKIDLPSHKEPERCWFLAHVSDDPRIDNWR